MANPLHHQIAPDNRLGRWQHLWFELWRSRPLTDQLSEEGIKEEATVDVLEPFNRRPIGEWQLEVIGYQNDRVPMTSKSVKASSLKITAVDRNVQDIIQTCNEKRLPE